MTCLFFFNDTATTEIYTLSLHDALPISIFLPHSYALSRWMMTENASTASPLSSMSSLTRSAGRYSRSEEHTSELQSLAYLVCRLLLEKKKNIYCFAGDAEGLKASSGPYY